MEHSNHRFVRIGLIVILVNCMNCTISKGAAIWKISSSRIIRVFPIFQVCWLHWLGSSSHLLFSLRAEIHLSIQARRGTKLFADHPRWLTEDQHNLSIQSRYDQYATHNSKIRWIRHCTSRRNSCSTDRCGVSVFSLSVRRDWCFSAIDS